MAKGRMSGMGNMGTIKVRKRGRRLGGSNWRKKRWKAGVLCGGGVETVVLPAKKSLKHFNKTGSSGPRMTWKFEDLWRCKTKPLGKPSRCAEKMSKIRRT